MINLPHQIYYLLRKYLLGLCLHKDNFKSTEQIMSELAKNKIGTRPFLFDAQNSAFNKAGLFLEDDLPNSEKLYRNGFNIFPSGNAHKDQINKVWTYCIKVLS